MVESSGMWWRAAEKQLDSVVEVIELGNGFLRLWSGKEKGWEELQGRSKKCIKEGWRAVHYQHSPGIHAEEEEKCRPRKRRIWSLQVQQFVKLDKLELFLLEEDGSDGEALQSNWIQEH